MGAGNPIDHNDFPDFSLSHVRRRIYFRVNAIRASIVIDSVYRLSLSTRFMLVGDVGQKSPPSIKATDDEFANADARLLDLSFFLGECVSMVSLPFSLLSILFRWTVDGGPSSASLWRGYPQVSRTTRFVAARFAAASSMRRGVAGLV